MDKSLSPRVFDRATSQAARQKSDRIIWTSEAIAARIGTSADFVRNTLSKQPGSPVRQIAGRYCAHEGDLIAYFRTQPSET